MFPILSETQVEQFITDGYVRIDNAFTAEIADAATDILWNDIPFDRNDTSSWTEPVVRLGMYTQPPFIQSVNTPQLHAAFDILAGPGKWIPCRSVGTFPVRFPSSKQPIDTGKHVDASFAGDDPTNYFEWRVNIKSKGRALLMLVLYSDVSDLDAPTIIYKGSHTSIARLLYPYGDSGLSFMEIADQLSALPLQEEVLATGKSGTIYLCHPFLVHSAQAHLGSNPKFMAQPPLLSPHGFDIGDSKGVNVPVELAIKRAIVDL